MPPPLVPRLPLDDEEGDPVGEGMPGVEEPLRPDDEGEGSPELRPEEPPPLGLLEPDDPPDEPPLEEGGEDVGEGIEVDDC